MRSVRGPSLKCKLQQVQTRLTTVLFQTQDRCPSFLQRTSNLKLENFFPGRNLVEDATTRPADTDKGMFVSSLRLSCQKSISVHVIAQPASAGFT